MSKQQRQQKPDSGSRRRTARLWLAYDRGDHLAAVFEFPSANSKTNRANLHLVKLPFDADPEVEAYATRFQAAWRSSVESIIEAGRILVEAKGALRHGRFGTMLDKLNLGARTAQMLMAI